jgi:hypothetical protein
VQALDALLELQLNGQYVQVVSWFGCEALVINADFVLKKAVSAGYSAVIFRVDGVARAKLVLCQLF